MSNDHLFLARLDSLYDVFEKIERRLGQLVELGHGLASAATGDPDNAFASPLLDRLVVAEEETRLRTADLEVAVTDLARRLGIIAGIVGP